jgi:hypothetical protein
MVKIDQIRSYAGFVVPTGAVWPRAAIIAGRPCVGAGRATLGLSD